MIGQYFKSRLLLPIYAVLIVIAIVQAILLIAISNTNISSLQDTVNGELENSLQKITTKFEDANQRVEQLNTQMSQKVSSKLTEDLTGRLEDEGMIIGLNMNDYLVKNGATIADVMSQLAPPYYWDDDIPELTRMVELVNKLDDVVFAVYLNKDEKPLTRYLDRNKALVKELMGSSSAKGAVNKILDASPSNENIVRVTRNVKSNDVVLGRFIVGMSKVKVKEEIDLLNLRFSELVEDTEKNVTQIISSETSDVTRALKETNDGILTSSKDSLHKTNEQMDKSASDLSISLLSLVIITSIVLCVVVAIALGVKVLNKVNVLKTAIWDIAEGEGDLTQRARVSGNDEISDMADGLNKFIENTQQVVSEVNTSASAAAERTNEMAAVSQMINESVDTQRNELNQVSSAMSEMASTVQHVSESIRNTNDQVEQINNDATKTSQVAADVRMKLNNLTDKVSDATTVVDKLNTYTNEIGSVLEVIQGIAEQTNLLALNAAIEAARAGESGRGFAVVADEVRALASKTQQSTEEIQQSIQNLQSGSSRAVEAIQDANILAGEGIDAFAETDALLENVNAAVSALFGITSEIASMSSEQTQVAEEIERNIVTIFGAAEQTLEQVQKSAAASSELDSTVSQLHAKASRFKV